MKSLFSHSHNHGADLSRSATTCHNPVRVSLFGRAVFAAAFCLLTLPCGAASAADTPSAAVAYRPGDTVRVFVTFKEPVSLKGGSLRFSLQGTPGEGQKVFVPFFDAATPVRLSDREFEFQAKLVDNVASGTYELRYVYATDAADLTRNYNEGPDFPVVTICVRNEKRVAFPDIKAVRVGEPEGGRP